MFKGMTYEELAEDLKKYDTNDYIIEVGTCGYFSPSGSECLFVRLQPAFFEAKFDNSLWDRIDELSDRGMFIMTTKYLVEDATESITFQKYSMDGRTASARLHKRTTTTTDVQIML